MALIATKTLRIGFTIAALPGNLVSPDAVTEYGWQDGVKDDRKGDVGGSTDDTETTPTAAKKRSGK